LVGEAGFDEHWVVGAGAELEGERVLAEVEGELVWI
jgi:hypothetical protein